MPSPSPVRALEAAVRETRRSLFEPFRFQRWLVLGFVVLIDQCTELARTSSDFGVRVGTDGVPENVVKDWMMSLAARPWLAVALAAAVLAMAVAVGAVALWFSCRGRFVYIDDVARGTAEIRRPWREHAGRASSHFAWLLGVFVATFLAVLALALPAVWAGVSLHRSGAHPGPIVVLILAALVLVAVALVSLLLRVAMRDFVAPLQWFADLPCGAAVRLFASLVRAHPGVFVLYGLLKFVFTIVFAMIALMACCLCCCTAFPFVQQVVLQPLFYCERRWPLEVLAELGYGPPAATALPIPEPEAPPESPAEEGAVR
jgi:hypothetical protein